jgi:hypothetical protein
MKNASRCQSGIKNINFDTFNIILMALLPHEFDGNVLFELLPQKP